MPKRKKSWLLFLLFSFFLIVFFIRQQSYKPDVSAQDNCPKKVQGDADCNGLINDADFLIWKAEFLLQIVTLPTATPGPSGQPPVSPTVTGVPPTATPTISSCRTSGQRCSAFNRCCSGLSCRLVYDPDGSRISRCH